MDESFGSDCYGDGIGVEIDEGLGRDQTARRSQSELNWRKGFLLISSRSGGIYLFEQFSQLINAEDERKIHRDFFVDRSFYASDVKSITTLNELFFDLRFPFDSIRLDEIRMTLFPSLLPLLKMMKRKSFD